MVPLQCFVYFPPQEFSRQHFGAKRKVDDWFKISEALRGPWQTNEKHILPQWEEN
jgi:hypothetical protein